MPVKRRNHGRNKKNKGLANTIQCCKCMRLCGKDKAIKRFQIKNFVDASSKRDIEEASAYNNPDDPYVMPKLFIKYEYCISCGIHNRTVKVK